MKKNNKKKRRRVLYWVILVLLFAVFAGCLIYLVRYFWESKKSEDRVDELKKLIVEEKEPDTETSGNNSASDDDTPSEIIDRFVNIDGKMVLDKYENLYKLNNDFIGWLSIDGMVIDYPVMQSMYDEEYYLRRDFDKEYSYPGTLFIDTSCDVEKPSDNIIIYGHHMNTGKMFHDLEKYEDESFYEKHKYITFDTIYGRGEYEVVAAFRTKIYDVYYTGFKYYTFFNATDKADFDYFMSNCKSLTPYNIETSAEYGDKLITLSTCAYHTENGRFVVVAKKIK